jgi:putative NIF3 family GTP cyclohydrolase 1 type 2
LSNPPVGFEGSGEGKIITLANALSLDECVQRVKTLLGLKYRSSFPVFSRSFASSVLIKEVVSSNQLVQLARAPEGKMIKTIAICAGSGESMLKGPADLYLTGE